MRYGDLGKRIAAYFIDAFVLFLIGTFLGCLVYVLPPLAFAVMFVAPLISVVYFVAMEGGPSHATLGKKLMGLYVADANGNGITYATAILRFICKFLSGLIFGIGYIMGLFDSRKQCLHDMLAKTFVLEGNPNAVKPRMPQLVGVSGPLAGMVYEVGSEGLVIGRDSVSCQVVLPATQAKVSRTHCFVSYNAGSGMFILNDRNSSHGTFLSNGVKVGYSQPSALRSGDRFYLATPDNTFEVR